jgi:hypothetical protein
VADELTTDKPADASPPPVVRERQSPPAATPALPVKTDPPALAGSDKAPADRSVREVASRRFELLHRKRAADAVTREPAPLPVLEAPPPPRFGVIAESARIVRLQASTLRRRRGMRR